MIYASKIRSLSTQFFPICFSFTNLFCSYRYRCLIELIFCMVNILDDFYKMKSHKGPNWTGLDSKETRRGECETTITAKPKPMYLGIRARQLYLYVVEPTKWRPKQNDYRDRRPNHVRSFISPSHRSQTWNE